MYVDLPIKVSSVFEIAFRYRQAVEHRRRSRQTDAFGERAFPLVAPSELSVYPCVAVEIQGQTATFTGVEWGGWQQAVWAMRRSARSCRAPTVAPHWTRARYGWCTRRYPLRSIPAVQLPLSDSGNPGRGRSIERRIFLSRMDDGICMS